MSDPIRYLRYFRLATTDLKGTGPCWLEEWRNGKLYHRQWHVDVGEACARLILLSAVPFEEDARSLSVEQLPGWLEAQAAPTAPWVIEPPLQKQIRCPPDFGGCGALIGFTTSQRGHRAMATPDASGRLIYQGYDFIRCPVCQREIVVKQ